MEARWKAKTFNLFDNFHSIPHVDVNVIFFQPPCLPPCRPLCPTPCEPIFLFFLSATMSVVSSPLDDLCIDIWISVMIIYLRTQMTKR